MSALLCSFLLAANRLPAWKSEMKRQTLNIRFWIIYFWSQFRFFKTVLGCFIQRKFNICVVVQPLWPPVPLRSSRFPPSPTPISSQKMKKLATVLIFKWSFYHVLLMLMFLMITHARILKSCLYLQVLFSLNKNISGMCNCNRKYTLLPTNQHKLFAHEA